MSVVSFGCCLLFLGCCSCCGCCCGCGCCRACGAIVGVLLIRIKTVFWLYWNYSGDIVFSRRDSLVRCAAGDAHYFSLGVDDALLHLAHEKPNVFTEELKFPMHLCPYLLGMLHSSKRVARHCQALSTIPVAMTEVCCPAADLHAYDRGEALRSPNARRGSGQVPAAHG